MLELHEILDYDYLWGVSGQCQCHCYVTKYRVK